MKLKSALAATRRHIWKNSRLETAILAAVFPFALCLFLTLPAVIGCASTPAAIAREQKIYSTATNVVSTLENSVPAIPAPYNAPVEGILAVVTACLTAWNIHQQKAISALKNGKSNGSNAPPASQASKPAPAPPTTPA